MSSRKLASSESSDRAEIEERLSATALMARLRRLCVLVGVAVALFPPAFFYVSSRTGLEQRARAQATGIAQPITALAARHPHLWRYNLNKVVLATAPQRQTGGLGEVRITDCRGRVLLSDEALHLGSGEGMGPTGWAPVVVFGQLVAWVAVRMDAGAERQRLIAIALGAALLGVLVGLYLHRGPARGVRDQAQALETSLQQLRSTETQLSAANSDLHARVKAAVEELRELSERVISTQERERERIALELHDGVGQHLTALRLTLERVARGDSARVAEAIALCDETLSSLRLAVFDLRPLELQQEQLAGTLRAAAERFELRTGVAAPFRHEGPDLSSASLARTLLRVTQEAMNNAIRHGRAQEIGLRLTVTPDNVELQIQDDGTGFDVSQTSPGTGLTGMRERMRYLRGTLEVYSEMSSGTRVVAIAPLSPPKSPNG